MTEISTNFEYYQKVSFLYLFALLWGFIGFLLAHLDPYLFFIAYSYILMSLVVSIHNILLIAHGKIGYTTYRGVLRLQLSYTLIFVVLLLLREYIQNYYVADSPRIHSALIVFLMISAGLLGYLFSGAFTFWVSDLANKANPNRPIKSLGTYMGRLFIALFIPTTLLELLTRNITNISLAIILILILHLYAIVFIVIFVRRNRCNKF